MSETLPPVFNPSAKYQFVTNGKRTSAHNNLMQQEQMQDSVNMSLLEYQRRLLVGAKDANAAAAAGLKLKGALELVDIMFKLGQIPTKTEVAQTNHLDYSQ